jgi:hypothetical protein
VTDANSCWDGSIAVISSGGRWRSIAARATASRRWRGDCAVAATDGRGHRRGRERAMVAALRVISVERGHDPRAFTLVAFGGAAALHACELAAELGMRRCSCRVIPGCCRPPAWRRPRDRATS